MSLRQPIPRPAAPASWRRLVVGLLATLALSLQSGAALAHNHFPAGGGVSASIQADTAAGIEQDLPGQPAQDDRAAQCPLCHSPLSHGGILAPADVNFAAPARYAADNAIPPAQAPPLGTPRLVQPARGPPTSI